MRTRDVLVTLDAVAGVLASISSVVSSVPAPAGEFIAGIQRVRVLGAVDPLVERKQGGELVTGT